MTVPANRLELESTEGAPSGVKSHAGVTTVTFRLPGGVLTSANI